MCTLVRLCAHASNSNGALRKIISRWVSLPHVTCQRNSRLGLCHPSAAGLVSLQSNAEETASTLLLSIPVFQPYGVRLRFGFKEEMGSGFVCAPAAPQGPPKEVESEKR